MRLIPAPRNLQLSNNDPSPMTHSDMLLQSFESGKRVFDACDNSPNCRELQGKVCLTENGSAECQGLLGRGKRAHSSATGAK